MKIVTTAGGNKVLKITRREWEDIGRRASFVKTPTDHYAELGEKSKLGTISTEEVLEAQKMVEIAAQAAGYNLGPVWHGGRSGFVEFKGDMGSSHSVAGDGFYFSTSERVAKGYAKRKRDGATRKFYLRSPNHLTLYGEGTWRQYYIDEDRARSDGVSLSDYPGNQSGKFWNGKRGEESGYQSFPVIVDVNILPWVSKKAGYTGFTVTNISDAASKRDLDVQQDTVVVFNSSQIKSADPFTYRDDGTLIPLSERFNSSSNDIRSFTLKGFIK